MQVSEKTDSGDGCRQAKAALRYCCAGVAEWQTQRTQNPPGSRPCRFDSYLRHQHFSLQLEGPKLRNKG
jgi:hypothetical protein